MIMKRKAIVFLLVLAMTAAACELEEGPSAPPAGTQQICTTGGVDFVMIAVPAKTFPNPLNPNEPITVNKPFWLAETETTYELWSAVYGWAVDNGYTFDHAGVKGNDGAVDKSVLQPVTDISWLDALVWCNALTEWYNLQTGEGLACVYVYDNAIFRSSDLSEPFDISSLTISETAEGFRLADKDEFHLAAKYRGNDPVCTHQSPMDGVYWTSWYAASGATTTYIDPDDTTGEVAWFDENSEESTHEVKQKTPNTLGFYDMSGNVWEMCTYVNGAQFLCGGYKSSVEKTIILYYENQFVNASRDDAGFRVAKSM
jgi:hypothetical protein